MLSLLCSSPATVWDFLYGVNSFCPIIKRGKLVKSFLGALPVSFLTPAQMQALNQQAVIGDPRAANPLVGGILGASSSPFAKSLRDRSALAAAIAQAEASGQLTEMTQIPVAQNPRIMTQGPESLQAMMAQMRARNAQFGSGPVAQAPQLPELPSELQAISQFDDMNSRDRIKRFLYRS